MTVHHSPHAPVSAVVAPGLPPYQAPWDIELRGPLDAAGLERLLGELAAADPDPPGWRHRLLRHGPDHHTLRVSAPQGTPAAFLAGRIADRLTEPALGADCVVTPVQHAILAWRDAHRYEAVFVELAAPGPGSPGPGWDVDVDALRAALRAVAAAHPHLWSRLDEADGRRAGRGGRRRGPREAGDGRRTRKPDGRAAPKGGGRPVPPAAPDPLAEGEFADEAGFAALVDAAGRTLDPYAGIQLQALLARDRRPGVPRADRLVLIAHELAVDAGSWRILLDDLATALGTATARTPVRQRHRAAPDGLTDWTAELRELARDPAEAQHWSQVAERRAGAGRDGAGAPDVSPAPSTAPLTGAKTGGNAAPEAARGQAGEAGAVGPRAGFTLERAVTERIVHGLARRLALTTGQVLTGVFALALARWQGDDAVGFDVYSDPRAERPGLRRHTGRLTGSYPVQVTVDRQRPDALGRLTALAGQLAGCAGRAAGGAGFWACREWSPDPALRRALRDLPPASVRLTLGDPGGPLPGDARPVPGAGPSTGGLVSGGPLPGGSPGRAAHHVEARAYVRDRRLHVGLEPVTGPADGTTGPSAAALVALVRDLLQELATAPAAPLLPAFRATPQQLALYRGGEARPGTGRHVEQLVWVWHGPLDEDRFTASWQSVFDCETVLRTAFTEGAEPLLLVHDRVVPEITRRARPDDWSAFLERDRLRGFDLRRPGALRLTLLETERYAHDEQDERAAEPERPAEGAAADGARAAAAGTPVPATRIVITYHRALLDNWSAHLLLREFYRAYLAGGTLPGGERRPDLRDYAAWAAAQDPEPARGFWTDGTPHETVAARPLRPTGTAAGTPVEGGTGGAARPRAGRPGPTGAGRVRLRLDPLETTRLAHWAGNLGTAESSVLQAVWAMLAHRASGATGPARVCFAVTVSGRGIALDGVARMPGPLRNPLPMTVEVDPADTVQRLLRHLRDRALDMAAYEWVPADWARAWSRAGADADTVIVFEDPPHPLEGMEAQLAAHGIHAELPDTVPAHSVLPVGLLAHHDGTGGLVLTGVHDRALLDEEQAAELLAQSGLLLRSLPLSAGETTTVGEALALLGDRPGGSARAGGPGTAAPHRRTGAAAQEPPAPHGRDGGPLVTLRAARHDRAGRICLIPPPDAPGSCYDELARGYPGPQELLLLTARADHHGAAPALAALDGGGCGSPLLLAGFSGAGVVACDVARRIAAYGGRAPRVVLAGASADERERTRDLVRALEDAVPQT